MDRGNAFTINVRTPLLQTNVNHQQIQHQNHDQQGEQTQLKINVVDGGDGEEDETLLDKALQRLDFHLSFLGFNQRSALSIVLSWVGFLVVGVAVPTLLILELPHCSGCDDYQVNEFEYEILTSQVLLGAVSLICVSHNLRKKGIRKFLFVDKYKGHTSRFMEQYIKKIKVSYQLLWFSLLPCLILKLGHEVLRSIYMQNQSWWQAGLMVLALTISWAYLSAVSLVACILFYLSCSLQFIHFNDYMDFLERKPDSSEKEPEISFLMTEHIKLRHNLSKISHRFRIYLLLVFLIVTATLFATLVQITGSFGRVTYLNGGNFAVTSIVQVFETLLCLHAGTKISSKAQSIGAAACKCHALAVCKSSEGTWRSETVNRSISLGSLPSHCSESDLESLSMYTSIQLASISSYQRWQSFVTYLQANPGGITLYGWTVDRNLLTTIFFIELSLVLFVLGQTLIFSSETPQ